MKTYKIERANGDKRTAASLRGALTVARRMLGVHRIYRGAEYQTDRPDDNGEREYCTGLDIWTSRKMAITDTGKSADVVISW